MMSFPSSRTLVCPRCLQPTSQVTLHTVSYYDPHFTHPCGFKGTLRWVRPPRTRQARGAALPVVPAPVQPRLLAARSTPPASKPKAARSRVAPVEAEPEHFVARSRRKQSQVQRAPASQRRAPAVESPAGNARAASTKLVGRAPARTPVRVATKSRVPVHAFAAVNRKGKVG